MDSRMNIAKEWTSDLEDRILEITNTEQQREDQNKTKSNMRPIR